MVIRRGEIWWASLPSPIGSEPGNSRPLVVVQCNEFNRSRIQTVIAVTLTSNLNLGKAPGNVELPSKTTGLLKNSVANVSQIVTMDKSNLREKLKTLKPNWMDEIDAGIRLVLGLDESIHF